MKTVKCTDMCRTALLQKKIIDGYRLSSYVGVGAVVGVARVRFADRLGGEAEPVGYGVPFFVIPRENEALLAVGAFRPVVGF